MDLKQRRITLGELWDDPRSRRVFQKRIPMLSGRPLQGAARTVTLEQLADLLGGWVPRTMVKAVLEELERL